MDDEELTVQLLSEFNKSIDSTDEFAENNDNECLNQYGRIIVDFEWIEGLRSGSRLVWVPKEECIYYSNAISKKHNAIACTCYDSSCKERIMILEDGTATRLTNTINHTHGSLYNVYKERTLYTFMKERCRTAPASALIRDIYNEAVVK